MFPGRGGRVGRPDYEADSLADSIHTIQQQACDLRSGRQVQVKSWQLDENGAG